MNSLFRLIRFIPHLILGVLTFISKIILQLIIGILTPISKVASNFLNKLRLSITLKLNLFYGLCYILFFAGTYSLTLLIYFIYLEGTIQTRSNLFISLTMILAGSMFLSFILFLIVGRLGAKKILSPIKKLDTAIQETNANQLGNRLNITGTKDELKDLAKTFNSMMDRLEIFIDKQKQFVSDASHELRTPIAVIQGYANLLSRWGKDDPQILEESICAIKQETDNMQQLVEKLLFLARSDKDTQIVEKAPMNLSTLAHEVIKETSFINDEHEFIALIEDDITISGDHNLIKELMRILIDNAIKYTPEDGKITITVKKSANNAILAIKDTGIGIDAQYLPFIFERFYRVDEARTSQSGGTGLGLPIAKWIVDIHDGKIYVDSKAEVGTEFIVFFNNL